MIVAFDADVLCLLLYPSITPPSILEPGNPWSARARLQHLVTELGASRARIAVPAPALAEFRVVAGDRGPDYIKVIDKAGSLPHRVVRHRGGRPCGGFHTHGAIWRRQEVRKDGRGQPGRTLRRRANDTG